MSKFLSKTSVTCQRCGDEATRTSNFQKYCSSCSDVMLHESTQRTRARWREKTRTTPITEKRLNRLCDSCDADISDKPKQAYLCDGCVWDRFVLRNGFPTGQQVCRGQEIFPVGNLVGVKGRGVGIVVSSEYQYLETGQLGRPPLTFVVRMADGSLIGRLLMRDLISTTGLSGEIARTAI